MIRSSFEIPPEPEKKDEGKRINTGSILEIYGGGSNNKSPTVPIVPPSSVKKTSF